MSELLYPYGFIYETTCIPKNMKYRGSHRREQNPNDPDDSWYLGSPTNPQFWEDLEEYGRSAFVRKILEDVYEEDKKLLKKRESYYLKEVDAMRNPLYYNRSNSAEYGGGANEGMRIMHKGDTEKYFNIEDISLAESEGWLLGCSENHNKSNSASQKGKNLPSEIRLKISNTLRGDSNPMRNEINRQKVALSKLDKIWVHKGNIQTYIDSSEIDSYLIEGYELGMIKRGNKSKKDYDCHCRICGIDYKGGKYSSVCRSCYSDMKRKEQLNLIGGIRNEEK